MILLINELAARCLAVLLLFAFVLFFLVSGLGFYAQNCSLFF